MRALSWSSLLRGLSFALPLVPVVAIALAACEPREPSAKLDRAMEGDPGMGVSFADIAPYPWDRMFVFEPYSSHATIEAKTGPFPANARLTIDTNDGVVLVTFVRDNHVAGWFEHPRKEVDLATLARRPEGFAVCYCDDCQAFLRPAEPRRPPRRERGHRHHPSRTRYGHVR
jgi:hypothetical protein